jgi:glycyl-tRNA synthetase beta chain
MSANQTLLIEIGTEELPPNHLNKLSSAFAQSISHAFHNLGIPFSKEEHFITPRRIAVRFFAVPAIQPGRLIQKKGPALAAAFDAKGNPTPATLGFARSCKMEPSELKVHETDAGASWLVCEFEQTGQPLLALLPAIIEEALNKIPAAKRMRWGNGVVEFLRPLHWITVVHGTMALPVSVFGLVATNQTYGHRIHAPHAITIDHADNYLHILREAKVIADQNERREIIENAIVRLGEQNGGKTILDEGLLDQVCGLVEWPVPLYAHFNRAFLEVPHEALISSMENHQKCFGIKNSQGKLLPTFILISNTEPQSPENIVQGNERVMHARLADAKFFYDKDRKTPLASRLEGLKSMIFQKKLGSLYDKSKRVAKLAVQIAQQINASVEETERTAKLFKADLLTDMVFEFPELQGIMGGYYALNDGEPPAVAVGIRESYLPRFAKDELPQSPVGICVALADRLDTLLGIFGIGQMPTGDKDPFALRRQALAILRIIIENALPLDLDDLCHRARHGYGSLIDEEVVPQVVNFCFDRFRAWYQEQAISPQTIEAVLANHITRPYDLSRRILAVDHFQTLSEAQHLASANKRVRNILQKGGIAFNLQQLPAINPKLLKETAEIELVSAIEDLKKQTDPLIANGKYQEALVELARLQKPVDTFFEQVMVMTDDNALRQNRINLLSHLSALFMQIADVSKLAL